MTPIYLPLAIIVSILCVGHAQASAPSLYGQIKGTICAAYTGHARMMGEMKSMGTDMGSCIQKCLQLGGKYVLYHATNGGPSSR